MSSNVNLKLRKKAYDSSDDDGAGVVVFNTTDKNLYLGGEKYGETKLSGLTDTTITSATNGQALVYDSTSSKWINGDINIDLAESITYSNLVSLISANSGAGSLVPGKLYRITDYVTTTVQTNTQSANHPFDLVVMATSPNTLDCQAKATLHAGDTYFSASGNTCDLSKWQIWYDINNDATKYAWADSTNGKGVIYRLIDDLDNDCPYDFKNIQFKRKLTSGAYDPTSGTDTWVYTFSIYQSNTIKDSTLVKTNEVYSNKQGDYISSSKLTLNDNVFIGIGCYSNTFGNYCYSNTFGNSCNSNTFGNDCYSNTFGNDCNSNTFGNDCYSNTFGDRCYSNTFGNNCTSNTFGDYCYSNTFGNDCYSNTFGDYCYSNTFGDGCNNIIFGNSSNQGGTYCSYNIIENGNQYIRLYQTAGTAGDNNQLQNIYIAQGVNKTTTWLDISTIARNLSYRTTVGKESDGTLRIYNEDDNTTLSGLTDTTISSPSNNQVLIYNSATSKWVNGTMSAQATNYDFTHTSNTTISTTSATITFAENTRSSKMITTSQSTLNLTFYCNNYSDNYLWILNSGSSDLTVTIATFYKSGNVSVSNVYWPTDGITVAAGKVCEIGVVVNTDGAFITSREDLALPTV